jgi:hypothetical protein
MDRITKSILDEFAKQNTLVKLDEEAQFEHLTAFLAIRRHFGRALTTSDVVVGKGGDTGVDAIAIIVNGALMTDVDQVQEMLDQNGYLEATFIFVQAERSASFDGAKIGTIGNGVVDFFSETPKMDRNDKVKDAAAIMTAVYDRSTDFRKRPSCRIYYVTTGKWVDDKNLLARRDAAVSDVKSTEMFDEVDFFCLGADEIHRLYQATKNAIVRSFVFEEKVEVPKVPGVELAFLGFVSAKDFISIIRDDAGDDIIGSIFYDNVRDWQDYNPVNSEMRTTLSSDKKARFVLMNNGVTIIAKGLKQAGSNFTIEDFQIVNGCQTSHVIFDQRKSLTDDTVAIPLRLIATKDDDVIESIVLATNRQTELKPEQLYALTEFSKALERHFASYDEDNRLYYERRDGQYDRLPIEKGRIVSPQNEVRAFAAMFLEEPHTSTKNYKLLRANVGKNIFVKSDKLEPYYVAALAAYKLELQYRSHKIGAEYKSARHHILLALRLLMDPLPLSPMNSKEMEKRCGGMIKILWDAGKTDALFQEAKKIIDEVSGGNLSRDHIRTITITQAILKKLKKL